MLRLTPAALLLGGLLLHVSLAGHSAQAAVLSLQSADANDYNGTCVDISGDTILVGGYCAGAEGIGWVQVFERTGSGGSLGWEYQHTLISDDPSLSSASRFGCGLGIDGDTAVVGAYGNDTVYTFSRVAGVWSEEYSSRLTQAADGFGYDVRIDQNRVIVGAQPADHAYVYSSEITGGQSLSFSGAEGSYGSSVAISDARAVVGDPEANQAYFYDYQYDDNSETWAWVEEAAFSTGSNDNFGTSVAIDGDWAIVGADKTDLGDQYDAGLAIIYHHDGTNWGDPVTLAPSELAMGDQFGTSVAISGDTAVVGAINQGPFGSRTGSVYVFKRIDDVWVQSGKLQPSDGADGDEFGHAVAIDGDWIVVGSWHHDSSTGAAYVFEKPDYVSIPGDANLDNKVDETDMAILNDHWQTASGMGWTDGDFNHDHAVDAADAAILAAHWHVGVNETMPVPEPAMAALFAGLLLLLAARRRP